MNLTDSFVLDGIKRTKDGYLAAFANVARTGIQKYKGYELGRPDLGDVMVYRSPEEVFHKDSLRSMAHRPVTLTHPTETVDAKNWKKYAKGHTGDEVVRDGDHVRVPMVLMDAEAIDAVEKNGVRELSMGYSTDLKWTPGVAPDGKAYDAIQTEIRANHLALVPVARGGDKLRFGDGMTCPECGSPVSAKDKACDNCGATPTKDSNPAKFKTHDSMKGRTKMPKIISIDGAPVEVADELSAAVITNKMKVLSDAVTTAEEKAAKAEADKAKATDAAAVSKTAIDTKDGEIAVLKKQLADAAMTPEKLDALVAERSAVIDAASLVLDAKAFSFDGKKIEEIRRAAVAAKLGDAVAKDMNDAVIEGAFRALTVDAPKSGTRGLADAFQTHRPNGGGVSIKDAAHAEYTKNISDAWRSKPAASH